MYGRGPIGDYVNKIELCVKEKKKHIWKPKNHYFSHFPLDILRWGPPRAYWCMNFEHENQLVKSAFDTCNFSNVLFSAADEKSLRVALEELEARFQK